MKSRATWVKGFESVVDNGRGDEYVVDLPPSSKGEGRGPTAHELSLMSLAGCINTIFALMARKMRLTFGALEVDLDAEKNDRGVIERVSGTMRVSSDDPLSKLTKCMDITISTCPVGVLYENAGVEMDIDLQVRIPSAAVVDRGRILDYVRTARDVGAGQGPPT